MSSKVPGFVPTTVADLQRALHYFDVPSSASIGVRIIGPHLFVYAEWVSLAEGTTTVSEIHHVDLLVFQMTVEISAVARHRPGLDLPAEVPEEPEAPARIDDLMTALEKSLAAVREHRKVGS